MNSKEKILEEFDKIIGEAPELVRLSKVSGENVCFVCGQPFNKSEQVKQLKQFLSQAIDQTREETIRDLLSSVQENRDEFFKGENDRGRLYYNGLIDLLNKILNKLKK